MSNYSFILKYEAGEVEDEDELVEGFQGLIDTGLIYQLQGFYGREADRLIRAGLCYRSK